MIDRHILGGSDDENRQDAVVKREWRTPIVIVSQTSDTSTNSFPGVDHTGGGNPSAGNS